MQKLNAAAYARREEAEAIASKGDLDSLIAGFKKYQEILSGPPVTLVAESRELAEQPAGADPRWHRAGRGGTGGAR